MYIRFGIVGVYFYCLHKNGAGFLSHAEFDPHVARYYVIIVTGLVELECCVEFSITSRAVVDLK